MFLIIGGIFCIFMSVKWIFKPDTDFQPSLIKLMQLTPGEFYHGDFTPQMWDPDTYVKVEPHLVVKCDDGKLRKLAKRHFISLEELRDKKLGDLGI